MTNVFIYYKYAFLHANCSNSLSIMVARIKLMYIYHRQKNYAETLVIENAVNLFILSS